VADDYCQNRWAWRELVPVAVPCLAPFQTQWPEKISLGAVLTHAELTLYPDEFRVTRTVDCVSLAPKGDLLFDYMILTLPGLEPQPADDQVGKTDYVVDTKTVDVHIAGLREEKL